MKSKLQLSMRNVLKVRYKNLRGMSKNESINIYGECPQSKIESFRGYVRIIRYKNLRGLFEKKGVIIYE